MPGASVMTLVETEEVVAQPFSAAEAELGPSAPVRVQGKFFFVEDKKHFVKGVTYGPFPKGSHGALARRRRRAQLPPNPRRWCQSRASRRARQLRQLSIDRIPDGRFHRFHLLQRLSARPARLPPIYREAAQCRSRPAAGADRIRCRFVR